MTTTPVAIALSGTMQAPRSAQPGAQRFFLLEKSSVSSVVDTDTDGIPDVYELLRPPQLDPLNPADAAGDPDGNGQTFLQEYLASVRDLDHDGLPNELEDALGLSPYVADTDGDGLMDGLEDFDNDGLPNVGEVLLGREPTVPDSDHDGIQDGDEDSDADSLRDGLEVRLGTNPLAADSDLDGWPDETEVTAGSNPLEGDSKPRLFLAAQPQLTLVLPAAAGAEGLAPNTVAAQPSLTLVLPTAEALERLAPNTVLARPPLILTLPTSDQNPGFRPNVTLGRPPLVIQFRNP